MAENRVADQLYLEFEQARMDAEALAVRVTELQREMKQSHELMISKYHEWKAAFENPDNWK